MRSRTVRQRRRAQPQEPGGDGTKRVTRESLGTQKGGNRWRTMCFVVDELSFSLIFYWQFAVDTVLSSRVKIFKALLERLRPSIHYRARGLAENAVARLACAASFRWKSAWRGPLRGA